ncbi:MAG: hypothetical protein ACI8XZ_003139 [Gammaproteobacteria bacterium]
MAADHIKSMESSNHCDFAGPRFQAILCGRDFANGRDYTQHRFFNGISRHATVTQLLHLAVIGQEPPVECNGGVITNSIESDHWFEFSIHA